MDYELIIFDNFSIFAEKYEYETFFFDFSICCDSYRVYY